MNNRTYPTLANSFGAAEDVFLPGRAPHYGKKAQPRFNGTHNHRYGETTIERSPRRDTPICLIFLDFDGVFHNNFCGCPEPIWYQYVADGKWTAQDFYHAAARQMEECKVKWKALSQLPLLEDTLSKHKKKRIVISSNQRFRVPGLADALKVLAPKIAHCVVGTTSTTDGKDVETVENPGVRSRLALRYIKEHNLPPDTPWLAIDDDAPLWEGHEDHLILTNGWIGFQPIDATALDTRLGLLSSSHSTVSSPQ